MFGPNTHFKFEGRISYSHRDTEFKQLFERVSDLFKKKFSLQNYDILFIPGSGTVGMESVIYSLNKKLYFPNDDGKFNQRWISMAKNYSKLSDTNQESLTIGCSLETSLSKHNEEPFDIVDSISSFPYYEINPQSRVFVTCCNKQIGSFVGLSIVGVRKDSWDLFNNTNSSDEDMQYSYLDLFRYKNYSLSSQTPTTTAVHIFSHLEKTLNVFDLNSHKAKISSISLELVKALGNENIIGDLSGPVITVPQEAISKQVSEKWSLYGGKEENDPYQIFTYSCDLDDYLNFVNDLELLGNG